MINSNPNLNYIQSVNKKDIPEIGKKIRNRYEEIKKDRHKKSIIIIKIPNIEAKLLQRKLKR